MQLRQRCTETAGRNRISHQDAMRRPTSCSAAKAQLGQFARKVTCDQVARAALG